MHALFVERNLFSRAPGLVLRTAGVLQSFVERAKHQGHVEPRDRAVILNLNIRSRVEHS